MRLVPAIAGMVLLGGVAVGPMRSPPSSVLEGPLTVNGPVIMTTGPHVVDGGITARTYEGESLTATSVDAGTVQAQAFVGGTGAFSALSSTGATTLGTTTATSVSSPAFTGGAGSFSTLTSSSSASLGPTTAPSFTGGSGSFTGLTVSGTTNFGTVNMGALTTAGPNTLNGSTSITGACTFSQPPTGLTRKGSLVRGASLGLALGCQDLGTVSVAGSTVDSACNVTRRPAPILNLGITLDCFVATPGVVTVRACALLALLSAPAGTYGVTLVGE